MNLLRLGIVGSVLLLSTMVGCQEEPKFTIPDDPAPWSPDLMPSAGGGGAGQRAARSKGKGAEKESDDSTDPSKSEGETSKNPDDKALTPEKAPEARQPGGTDQVESEKQGSDEKSPETQGNEGRL